ncbi:CS domain-containing protein [Colletotrichum gloeosporioides Cg-14]|uniref:Nuclear movement protein nudC n=1 Tax=Colletotrichum gloeosporioides (strain Cg-14) TaxID=1237896 RepID=T0KZC1_COLGC|nr:CS domain-containing protein [Colletotrichum gloeosporioides Cg-14]
MADKPEPTPAEEAAARAKEAEEQNALPYKWQQTIADVDVTFSVPGNYKSRDLVIDLKKNTISAGVKGQDPIIKGDLPHAIIVDDSTWTLASAADGTKTVEIHLDKVNKMEWWPHVVKDAPKIDVSKIQPDTSKLSDLDGETRGMKKLDILKKFQAEHPEMDFSNAKIS